MHRDTNDRRLTAIRTLTLCLVCALACPGCFTVLRDLQKTKLRLAKLEASPGMPSTYLQFQGKGRDDQRSGFVRAGYLLRQPVEITVQAGVYDPKRVADADGQRACAEVDERPNGGPLVFAVICADYFNSLGGYNVSFFHNLDGPTVSGPTVFVPGLRADLRIAGDMTDLTFSTRAPGATTQGATTQGATPWTEIGSTPYTRDPGLLPSVGATFLNKGGEIGFTSPTLSNGPHPREARTAFTPEDIVYEEIMWAEEHLFFACLFLESGDEQSALDELFDAADHLDAANGVIDSLLVARGAPLDPKALQKAAKNLAKAIGKAGKAQAKLSLGKLTPAAKQINKAIKKADKAALTFQPFENVI